MAHQLSNLCNYPFVMDGIKCESIEGFLQSIKFVDDSKAEVLRGLYGTKCFKAGQAGNDWKINQTLSWNGVRYLRSANGYQGLLERAYDACIEQNPTFRNALIRSKPFELRHDFGKTDMRDSVLTRIEYIYQLYRLRSKL
jgi:hypothetical protein